MDFASVIDASLRSLREDGEKTLSRERALYMERNSCELRAAGQNRFQKSNDCSIAVFYGAQTCRRPARRK